MIAIESDALQRRHSRDFALKLTTPILLASDAARMHPHPALSKLTPRERQCLALMAKLYSAKEQADLLRLSNRTVEGYLSSAARKLGASTSREAARLFAAMTLATDILDQEASGAPEDYVPQFSRLAPDSDAVASSGLSATEWENEDDAEFLLGGPGGPTSRFRAFAGAGEDGGARSECYPASVGLGRAELASASGADPGARMGNAGHTSGWDRRSDRVAGGDPQDIDRARGIDARSSLEVPGPSQRDAGAWAYGFRRLRETAMIFGGAVLALSAIAASLQLLSVVHSLHAGS
jgi:DNA-binding CsgD family transcriptional regulator